MYMQIYIDITMSGTVYVIVNFNVNVRLCTLLPVYMYMYICTRVCVYTYIIRVCVYISLVWMRICMTVCVYMHSYIYKCNGPGTSPQRFAEVLADGFDADAAHGAHS